MERSGGRGGGWALKVAVGQKHRELKKETRTQRAGGGGGGE